MRKYVYYPSVFLLGGIIYNLIETLFRGYTHVSMFFAGGICLLMIGLTDGLKLYLPFKLLICGAIITAVELLFGVVFNLILGMNVWDYSYQKWNLAGQICPRYSLFWIALSLPGIYLTRFLKVICRDNSLNTASEPQSEISE